MRASSRECGKAACNGTAGATSNDGDVLAFVALGALLLGIGAAAPSPVPAPSVPPAAGPSPVETTLPIIGTTRAKPVCTAIRRALAPAVAAALRNDRTYGGVRKRIFDYLVKDSSDARDLHLMQMDREVDKMAKDVATLEAALRSPALDVTPTTKPEDAQRLRELRAAMAKVLLAEKIELNAMSGFVEGERTGRFAKLNESQQSMQHVLWATTDLAPRGSGPLDTPPPPSVSAADAAKPSSGHAPVAGLRGAMLFDRDLGDIAKLTAAYEDAATNLIVPAANDCK